MDIENLSKEIQDTFQAANSLKHEMEFYTDKYDDTDKPSVMIKNAIDYIHMLKSEIDYLRELEDYRQSNMD